MKKLIYLSMLSLSFALGSCKEPETSGVVLTGNQEVDIIVIEGCEFYVYGAGRRQTLAKVDCDCKPKRD